jgi:hypothetical protein
MKTKKKEKVFDEHSCELKNEEECEDELDEEGTSLEKAEEEEFGEE